MLRGSSELWCLKLPPSCQTPESMELMVPLSLVLERAFNWLWQKINCAEISVCVDVDILLESSIRLSQWQMSAFSFLCLELANVLLAYYVVLLQFLCRYNFSLSPKYCLEKSRYTCQNFSLKTWMHTCVWCHCEIGFPSLCNAAPLKKSVSVAKNGAHLHSEQS